MHHESKSLFKPLTNSVGKLLLVVGIVLLSAACGKKDSQSNASQTIVRVNGDEITVLQLNNELQRANIQANQQERAGKQITAALVDRQILMQEAHKAKLDRNPRVVQAIEDAKAQILAQAYLESKVATIAKPTEAEIADYRAKHANIFASRKIFVMDELTFSVDKTQSADVQAISSSAKTIDDVKQWLDERQMKYTRNHATHAAETIPLQLLDKLSKMVVGDLLFINSDGGTVAAQMSEIKDASISEADSRPIIERLINEQKRKQIALDEVKRLRGASKIEYINKKFEATAAEMTSQTAPPEVKVETVEPKESIKPQVPGKVDSHIEKGLSGL